MLFDGRSNAKTNDEKEPFLIKACVDGSPCFNVKSLECAEDENNENLVLSLQNAAKNMKFTFNTKSKEARICYGITSINKSAYNSIQQKIFGPAHKHELAIKLKQEKI